MTLTKLLRMSSGFLNERDQAALKEINDNIRIYMLYDVELMD